MTFKHKLYSAILAGSTLLTMAGCSPQEETTTVWNATPVDKVNDGYGFVFELAEDDKTIEKFIYKQGIDKEFLEKQYPDEDIDSLFKQYKNTFNQLAGYYVNGNTDLTWMSFESAQDNDNYMLSFKMCFDFTDKNFKPDEKTLEYLTQTGVVDYYNEDEMRFEFTEEDAKAIEDVYKDSYIEFKCEKQEMENDKLESVKLKEAHDRRKQEAQEYLEENEEK